MSGIVFTEADLDAAILEYLMQRCGIDTNQFVFIPTGGKSKLDRRLAEANRSARALSVIVLRDMDFDACCPGELVEKLVRRRNAGLLIRIAVREIEAWLLADRDGFGSFMGVASNRIPEQTDNIGSPKDLVLSLAWHSKKSGIRADMVDITDINQEGPAYAERLLEFAWFHWSVDDAAERNISLRRCLSRLSTL
jgi:hypothetical protein